MQTHTKVGMQVHIIIAIIQLIKAKSSGERDQIINTKDWYKKEADLWAELGNKSLSVGKDFFRGFGRNTCGRQYVLVRLKDCLRWICGIAW
jgi:hypothetical protein